MLYYYRVEDDVKTKLKKEKMNRMCVVLHIYRKRAKQRQYDDKDVSEIKDTIMERECPV